MGKVQLGDYIERVSIRATDLDNYSKLEVLGVSNVNGITKTSHVKSADLGKYLYIEENYFAYNPYRINVGSIGLTQQGVKGLVSPAYIVFKTKDTLKPELLFDFLKSFDGLQQINKLAKGTVRKTLSFDNLSKIQLIVPSIEKQEAILKLKQNTENINKDLVSEISNQQELLKKLRQSILQEAIEGKLTASWREQNPYVENASVLLEKIKHEKEQLVKEKKIKKQKPLPPINEDEIPFDIPSSWEWCRLGEIVHLITDGAHHTPTYTKSGIHFLSVKDVAHGKIDLSNTKYISEATHKKLTERCNPEFGDLLLTKVGTTGIAKVIDIYKEFSLFVSVALLKFNQNYIFNYFLEHLINSPFVKNQSNEGTKGMGNKNLVIKTINNFIIPLPPLQEQKEIVRTIENLFKICDELETQINSSKINSQTLIQAVLKEAFESK